MRVVVVIFQTVVVYTSRLVAERVCVCVFARASEREREREGFFCSRKREEKRRNIFNTRSRVFSGFCE